MDHTKFAFLDEARRTQDLAQSLEFVADKFSLDQVAFCFPHSHEGVPEAWMADRLADEPRLSIFLTTAGYAPNNAAAVNRVGLDRPLGDPGPLDPGRILARAFLHAAVHRGAWRRPPKKSR